MHIWKTFVFSFIAILTVAGFVSCTQSFQQKMETAKSYLTEIGAEDVVVGTASESKSGTNVVMTTLKYSGMEQPEGKFEFEHKANKLAWDFYRALRAENFKGETHIQVTFVTKDEVEHSYTMAIEDLKRVADFQRIADAMVNACIEQDTATIKELKDNNYMPDEQMGVIYDVNAFNDSLYAGQQIVQEPIGFRFANGEEDKTLELFTSEYECGTPDLVTRYTVNVDRKTSKVVYLWLKTDPR